MKETRRIGHCQFQGDIPISEEKLDAILENSQVQDLLKGFLKDEVVDGTYRILLKNFRNLSWLKEKNFHFQGTM